MICKATTADAYKLLHYGSLELARVEEAGFRLDTDYLDQTTAETKAKIAALNEEMQTDDVAKAWRAAFGSKTNFASGPQLAHVLYNILGYECKELTAIDKRPKTDQAALDRIDHPFVRKLVRLGKLNKILSTYLIGWRREAVRHEDGTWRIHPMQNLNINITYRSSQDHPNLQNVPTRIPELAEITRRCFIPRPGHRIVETDFKAIEVGISACYHFDPTMIRYLEERHDYHLDFAKQCYLLAADQVSKDTRYCAKNKFVFPQFYGSVHFQCAPNLWEAIDLLKLKVKGTEVSVRDHLRKKGVKELGECDPEKIKKAGGTQKGTFVHLIKQVEEQMWQQTFPVYTKAKKRWWQEYVHRGYFDMHTGFRCVGIMDRNDVLNYRVQGAAFHCLLWCLIEINKELRRRKMRSRIVNQVHDSIVGDVHCDEYEDYLRIVHEVTTVRLPAAWGWIVVPVDVEMEVCEPGESWYTKKQIESPLAS